MLSYHAQTKETSVILKFYLYYFAQSLVFIILPMNRGSIEQPIKTFGILDLPICNICRLTEQRARCDVQTEKCGLSLCRKCQQINYDRQCDFCKKKTKEHRFKTIKQKLKNDISSRFEVQAKFRNKIRTEQKKYADIDQDMTHILSALLGQSSTVFNSTHQKDLDRLVEHLHKKRNTIESQIDRTNMPIFLKQIHSDLEEYNGMIACGYPSNDYSKGLNQIYQSFL